MDGAGVMVATEHPDLMSSHHWSQREMKKSEQEESSNESLPSDPRNWSRAHVERWLRLMAARHRIRELKRERFLMNGKALCLMSVDMYLERVPLGGKLLYRDFQLRLANAMHQ